MRAALAALSLAATGPPSRGTSRSCCPNRRAPCRRSRPCPGRRPQTGPGYRQRVVGATGTQTLGPCRRSPRGVLAAQTERRYYAASLIHGHRACGSALARTGPSVESRPDLGRCAQRDHQAGVQIRNAGHRARDALGRRRHLAVSRPRERHGYQQETVSTDQRTDRTIDVKLTPAPAKRTKPAKSRRPVEI